MVFLVMVLKQGTMGTQRLSFITKMIPADKLVTTNAN